MDDQTDLPVCHVGHGADVVRSLAVADGHIVAVFQAEHLCVRGIFTGQHQKAAADLLFRYKKTGHNGSLLSYVLL